MRQLLHRAVTEAGGYFTRDQWEAWELHEPGLAPAPIDEREAALDALEEHQYVKSLHAWGARHVRSEVTAKGRMVLGRQDVSLADALFSGGSTNVTTYDQRVGVQAQSFTNQGALQTGDQSTQYVNISNQQKHIVLEHLAQIREVLSDPDLPNDIVRTVQETADEIEEAMNDDATPSSRLHQLREKALGAAVTAAGTEAGKQLLQLIIDLGRHLPPLA
jgi:hypothetical protein